MSFPWKPPIYSVRQRDNQWINTIFTAHDIYCGCDHPPTHLLIILLREANNLGLKKQIIEQTQQCLGYGDKTTENGPTDDLAIATEEDYIQDGDLAELFKDDGENEDTR